MKINNLNLLVSRANLITATQKDKIRVNLKGLVSSQTLLLLLEAAFVVGWALFAGRALLHFDPNQWPLGVEFPLSVQENYFWNNVKRCGICAYWNGNLNGGYPALIDLQGAPLHPLVAIPTLLFGVVNGAKLTIILSLAMAGLAQWWLGRLLGLGRVARVWAALIAVLAGSVTGKMENGLVVLVLSTASASLVIPAGINLAQRPTPRSSVILALTLALALVSGQGYLQIGMVLSILPAFLILYLGESSGKANPLHRYLQAIGIAIIVAGVFIIPVAHQIGAFVKDTDPYYQSVQPIEYLLLNLVINDSDFFRELSLQKLPYPYLYINYIGWVPVLLAALALRLIPREKIRLLIFFLAAIALVYLNSTLILPKWLFETIANEFLIGIRHPTLMAGLAVPFILGLAAWGLDLALKAGPRVSLSWNDENESKKIHLSWIILLIPLIWGVLTVYKFSDNWLRLGSQPNEVQPILNAINPQSAEWIELPMGELFWHINGMERNYKLANAFHPWHLRDQENPPARFTAERSSPDLTTTNIYATIEGMELSKKPEVYYSAVESSHNNVKPCNATANGGFIAVLCYADEPGTLKVYEHNWSGWTVRVDGMRAQLEPGEWLAVKVPTGKHMINFTYMPWDVPLGLIISMVGIGLVIGLWRRNA